MFQLWQDEEQYMNGEIGTLGVLVEVKIAKITNTMCKSALNGNAVSTSLLQEFWSYAPLNIVNNNFRSVSWKPFQIFWWNFTQI